MYRNQNESFKKKVHVKGLKQLVCLKYCKREIKPNIKKKDTKMAVCVLE